MMTTMMMIDMMRHFSYSLVITGLMLTRAEYLTLRHHLCAAAGPPVAQQKSSKVIFLFSCLKLCGQVQICGFCII